MSKLKNTNKIATVFYDIFGTLPLLVTLYIYPYIPDNIPTHYWIDGSIDKWGNKNELFIVPIIIFLFARLQPRIFKLNFNYEGENKITKRNNYYFLLILNVLAYLTLYISMNFETCLSYFNFYNFFTCSICFIFAIVGNNLPDCDRNSSISIRNKYTLENQVIWNRTHRFCGFLWFSGSIVFFPMFLFIRGYYLLTGCILMICIFVSSPLIYTYYLHKKYLRGELDEQDKQTEHKNIQHSH